MLMLRIIIQCKISKDLFLGTVYKRELNKVMLRIIIQCKISKDLFLGTVYKRELNKVTVSTSQDLQ